jgi:hypothetical protein
MHIQYQDAYFLDGPQPKHWAERFELKNVPLSGRTRVLVWWRGEDSRNATLLHPFTLYASPIGRGAGEIAGMAVHEMPADMGERIRSKFMALQAMGVQASYDEAAKALTILGAQVPVNTAPETRQQRVGGKPPAESMGKTLRIGSKRYRIAEFFDRDAAQPIREAMAELDMSRNSVLSALYMLNKDTGVGYEVVGDAARLVVPKGWEIYEF